MKFIMAHTVFIIIYGIGAYFCLKNFNGALLFWLGGMVWHVAISAKDVILNQVEVK